MSKTESSKISKILTGYKDSSNNCKYSYDREGIVHSNGGIIISKSTFMVPKSKFEEISKKIRKKGIKITTWEVDLPKKHFK